MTMLEKVAAAIAVEIYKKLEWGHVITDMTQAEVEGIARAALEAMKTPTEGMVDAVHIADWLKDGADTIRANRKEKWMTMINAALEGK